MPLGVCGFPGMEIGKKGILTFFLRPDIIEAVFTDIF